MLCLFSIGEDMHIGSILFSFDKQIWWHTLITTSLVSQLNPLLEVPLCILRVWIWCNSKWIQPGYKGPLLPFMPQWGWRSSTTPFFCNNFWFLLSLIDSYNYSFWYQISYIYHVMHIFLNFSLGSMYIIKVHVLFLSCKL